MPLLPVSTGQPQLPDLRSFRREDSPLLMSLRLGPAWPAWRNMRENWETTGQPPPPGTARGRTGWGRQRWLTDETVPASVFMCVCVYLSKLRTTGMKSHYIRAPWGTHQKFHPDPDQKGFPFQWRGRGWGSTRTRKGKRENCAKPMVGSVTHGLHNTYLVNASLSTSFQFTHPKSTAHQLTQELCVRLFYVPGTTLGTKGQKWLKQKQSCQSCPFEDF